MSTAPPIAEAINRRIEAAGISENSLAKATLIPRITLKRIREGVADVKASQLARIALALNTTPADLFADADRITDAFPDA